MKFHQRNIILLFVITFLFLGFFLGFFNYIQSHILSDLHKGYSGKPGEIFFKGFQSLKNLIAFAFIALLFTFVSMYYWNKINKNVSVITTALSFTFILFVLFILYRVLFAIIGGYFHFEAIKRIGISALILIPCYLIIILPTIFLLKTPGTEDVRTI